MSTDKGLSKFNVTTKQFRNYDVKDGLQSNEYNRYSYWQNEDGTLFLEALMDSLFQPKEIQDNPMPPNVMITSFKLINRPVHFSRIHPGKQMSLSSQNLYSSPITLYCPIRII